MNRKLIRELDNNSIRKFIFDHKDLLAKKVLDFGCGTEPYKDLVSGEYHSYDPSRGDTYPQGKYSAILCNQVLEEVDSPLDCLRNLYDLLEPHGIVVLTFASAWEEWKHPDRWRFCRDGMKYLCEQVGFKVDIIEKRLSIPFEDYELVIGYGFIITKS